MKQPNLSTLTNQLKQIYLNHQVIGANLIITNQDNNLYTLSYGYSDLATNCETSLSTIYRIASISKTILALAAMFLVQSGDLDLDQDISSYLGFKVRNPYHPEVVITTRMLMTQTSSITDGPDDELLNHQTDQVYGYNGVNGTTLEVSLFDLLANPNSKYYHHSTFDQSIPGTKFIYSNFGCGIMTCIIENITGRYYDDYLQEVLFKPLNVKASFRIDRLDSSNVATCYEDHHGQYIIRRTKEDFLKNCYPYWPIGQNFRGPAGGLFISLDDLTIIMRAMINYQVPGLNKSTLALMFEKNWQSNDLKYSSKGLQMRIFDHFGNITTYGHFGSAYGIKSMMLFSPTLKWGITFITNGARFTNTKYGICDLHQEIYCLMVKAFLEVETNE